MRLIVATILALSFFCFSLGNAVQKPAQASKDEQELRKLEDEWLSTYLRGDKASLIESLLMTFLEPMKAPRSVIKCKKENLFKRRPRPEKLL